MDELKKILREHGYITQGETGYSPGHLRQLESAGKINKIKPGILYKRDEIEIIKSIGGKR
ncbi:MAG: hypothetical protein GY800_08965 [Planctomycetes bacterium]|nr:hypothetical protein [Planctomycetota bacterium]